MIELEIVVKVKKVYYEIYFVWMVIEVIEIEFVIFEEISVVVDVWYCFGFMS